jgi:exodeoxyribonuclease VII small subunit
MSTLLLSHPACLDHLTPPGHPERPDRLRAVAQVLSEARFDPLARAEAPEGSLDSVTLCHNEHYIGELRHIAPSSGMVYVDGDTSMSPGTWEAVMRGVGGAVAATDAIMSGTYDNAFVAIRPPGHHAETNKPMGFCFFDNAAIAARHAQRKYGIARAAVVDFDVHHGNGTQDIFWADPSVMYCSTHQMPLFPGTGAKGERGEHDTIVNAPLAPDDGSAKFRAAFENVILPQLQKFSPELVIISAGFDAHYRDPLASLNLKAEDFGWVTRKLMDVADKSAGGRVVSVLEGGYDLEFPPQYPRKNSFDSAPGIGRTREPDMAENTQMDVKKLSFERAIEELETIVKRLEDGKVPLEESVAIYERGEALKRRCEELLRQAEARVEKITTDADGQVTGTEPLDVQ